MELAAEENTVFALLPIIRIVPTTITRMTASMTAYSAISCPWSSDQRRRRRGRTILFTSLLELRTGFIIDGRRSSRTDDQSNSTTHDPPPKALPGLALPGLALPGLALPGCFCLA